MDRRLDHLCVVLIEPKSPGNIGSVARAMKNMGISHLRLVNPTAYRDDAEQRKMGYRSQEIISAGREFASLKDAVADRSVVFLATARKGKWKKDFLTPAQAAAWIADFGLQQSIALVFGREDKGATIDEAQLANYLIKIPSAVAYPSLNLAQAVMVVVYEVFQALRARSSDAPLPRLAERRAQQRLLDNIWELMKGLEVREPDQGLFHRSLKRALNRTQWTNADIAVFDRFCKQVRWYTATHCRTRPPEES